MKWNWLFGRNRSPRAPIIVAFLVLVNALILRVETGEQCSIPQPQPERRPKPGLRSGERVLEAHGNKLDQPLRRGEERYVENRYGFGAQLSTAALRQSTPIISASTGVRG